VKNRKGVKNKTEEDEKIETEERRQPGKKKLYKSRKTVMISIYVSL
jgi:hypothetical protein